MTTRRTMLEVMIVGVQQI